MIPEPTDRRLANWLLPLGAALALGALAALRALASVRAGGEVLAFKLRALFAMGWLAFGAGQVAVAMSGLVPASLMAVFAGGLYGFAKGLAISAVATMVGGWAAFLLARSLMRPLIERRVRAHPLFARIDRAVEVEGWRFVLLLRISPVMPFALTSYGLGLTRLTSREYLAGTLASLPPLVGYVALGALGREEMANGAGTGPWHLAMMAAGIAVVFYALARLRSTMARMAGDDAVAEAG